MRKLMVCLLLLPVLGWWGHVQGQGEKKDASAEVKAICLVTPFEKSKVAGVIRFQQKGNAVEITGELTGLTPGEHGFHIHEFGDISGKDGMTTGGHYNPTKKDHGSPKDENRHVGDLGNVTADKDGKAVISMKDSVIRLTGPTSIVGRAVIIHHDADDFKTQPTGHAGGRIAGGVIGMAK